MGVAVCFHIWEWLFVLTYGSCGVDVWSSGAFVGAYINNVKDYAGVLSVVEHR